MALPRRSLRPALIRLASVSASVVVALLAAEAVVRVFPKVLPARLRDAAMSRYDALPGGIYQYEGMTGMRFMRPCATVRAYSAGYTWIHQTDERGYRNPPGLADHRVLLLGDSLVYGHGVEGDQTVTHALRTEYGVAAYDMSAQGECLYEHYVTLRLFADELDPDTVLLFVFVNDIRDILKLRRHELEPGPPEIDRFDYELIRQRLDALREFRYPRLTSVAYSSSLVRLFAKTRSWRPAPPAMSITPPEWRPPKRDDLGRTDRRRLPSSAPLAVLDRELFGPINVYYDTVLGDLAARCTGRGTRLVVVHLVPPSEIDWPQRERAQEVLHRSLDAICSRHRIELVDTRPLFQDRTELILPGDGHLNPEGHRVLARFLAHKLLDQG
jgi:hypothetical protein